MGKKLLKVLVGVIVGAVAFCGAMVAYDRYKEWLNGGKQHE